MNTMNFQVVSVLSFWSVMAAQAIMWDTNGYYYADAYNDLPPVGFGHKTFYNQTEVSEQDLFSHHTTDSGNSVQPEGFWTEFQAGLEVRDMTA